MNRCTEEAVRLHEGGLHSLQMIANVLGVTRQAVKKYLNKRGYDTSKANAAREVKCTHCGKKILRARCWRRKTVRPFCSSMCYGKAIKNPDYEEHRQGQRIARREVLRYFELKESHVVHHEDGNNRNNDLSNLLVFRDQADHMRYHRLGKDRSRVNPLWSGINSS